MATTPIFPALWFTSGTPINVGMRECAMERYLSNHAGTHGTGFKKKSVAIPLATGSGVHNGVELIGSWILDWQKAHSKERLLTVPDKVIGWAANEAAEIYATRALVKGLELSKRDSATKEHTLQLIHEQRTLIEAQVWIYALARLPVMLADYRLINVEYEEGPVLDCTCGLGDWIGDWRDHHKRGCAGIVAQGRSDAIWQHVESGVYVYEELKTKATPNYGWEQQWETSGQLLLNMEAASRRLDADVSQAFVPVLYKGRRDRTDRDDLSSPKIQQSPLVWAWFDPGNGMNRVPEWSARYKFVDEYTGKFHTLPRSFTRKPVWDTSLPLEGNGPNDAECGPNATRVERWVKGWILPAQYSEILQVLGPFPKPRARVPDAVESLTINERKWRGDVAYLRAAGVYQPGDSATVREFLGAADGAVATEADYETRIVTVASVIPRSWACTKFDGTPCMFKPICLKDHPNWQHMELIEELEIRTPHHAIEKSAVEEISGVVFPDADEEDGE